MGSIIRIVVEVLLLVISVYLGYDKYIANTTIISIDLNFGDNQNSIQLTVSKSNLEFSTVMDSVWSNEESKEVTRVWLRKKGVFHYQDRELANFLSTQMAKTPSDGTIESSEERMNRLNKSLKDNPLISDLRDLARDYQPPFQHIGKKVRVGVPSGQQPEDDTVYVSFGSEFEGRKIQILNPKNRKYKVFRARGAFHATEAVQVDFQMNESQAIDLFGHVNFTAEAVATILPPGNYE